VTVTIYFDGSYRKETGEMYGALVCDGFEDLWEEEEAGTSSTHAEWIAALRALEFAEEHSISDILLIGDNKAVIDGMSGKAATQETLLRFRSHAEKLSAEFNSVRWDWISSEDNPAGEVLRLAHTAGKFRTRGLLA
jgi:ribonuclease HI